jgi:hypothetical protein
VGNGGCMVRLRHVQYGQDSDSDAVPGEARINRGDLRVASQKKLGDVI